MAARGLGKGLDALIPSGINEKKTHSESNSVQKKIDEKSYNKMISSVIKFLNGNYNSIIKELENDMYNASENLEFEKAAEIRDKISAVKKLDQKQVIENMSMDDRDVIAFARAGSCALVQVFFIRGGKMTGREHFIVNDADGVTRSEFMTDFVKRFYGGTPFIPKEIVLQEEIHDCDLISNWLSDVKGLYGKECILAQKLSAMEKRLKLL